MAQTNFTAHTTGRGNIFEQNPFWANLKLETSGILDNEIFWVLPPEQYEGDYTLARLFLPFDTSSIPDTDTIVSATLTLASYESEGAGTINGCLVQSTQASSTSLASGDFDAFNTTEGASRVSFRNTGSKVFTLNATGLGWISKTGYTKLAVLLSKDLDNVAPTMSDYLWASCNVSSATLSVTHYGADRYWVGGTGNWSDTSHWSETSGGSGGSPVPNSTNNVYFDSNSFSASNQTVTINTEASCLGMDWTGATNTPTIAGSADVFIYGSFTTNASMNWAHTGLVYLWNSGTNNFTSNGLTYSCSFVFGANGSGSYVLQDSLTTTNNIILTRGTLDTNGQTVSCKIFYSSYTTTRVLTLGSSTFTCNRSGSSAWQCYVNTGLTINAGTSSIILSGDNATFDGGSKTYNSVTFSGNNISVTGSNTFSTLVFTANKTVIFTAGTTQTVSTLTATGSAGNLITMRSSSTNSTFTISKSSGTVTCDYLDIKDCIATGGATFLPGDNSVDSGNNTGWSTGWSNINNVVSSNDTYATHTSPNGNLYVKLSKDGGVTWQNTLSVTHTSSEGEESFGDGLSELWGGAWVGEDVYDDNFLLRVYSGSDVSFNYFECSDFAFDGEISSTRVISGIEVVTEAKWNGTTLSLDHVKVAIYSGTSVVAINDGSFAYDTDRNSPVFYESSEWHQLANADGWQGAGETWTYASASTFTISGDKTGKYQIGDKIKLTQTTVKYFNIMAISYSSPNTTVSVTGGSDYTLANAAITSPYYSKIENPQGFPGHFAYTPSWTSTGSAPSIGNGALVGIFRMNGKCLAWNFYLQWGSTTSSGSGIWFFGTPITISGISAALGGNSTFFGNDAGTNTYTAIGTMEDTTKIVVPNSGGGNQWSSGIPFTWTNGDQLRASGVMFIG